MVKSLITKPMKWIPVRKAGEYVGKDTLTPILLLKLGDKYLVEMIIKKYHRSMNDQIRRFYLKISPMEIIYDSNHTKEIKYIDSLYTPIGFVEVNKFTDYHYKREDLFNSIRIIGHPDFISKTNRNMMKKGCYEYNILEDTSRDTNISKEEILINEERIKMKSCEKVKTYNKIIETYKQNRRDSYEECRYKLEEEYGDIPYDVPVYSWSGEEVINNIYNDYKSLSSLYNCGYLVDNKVNIFCIK